MKARQLALPLLFLLPAALFSQYKPWYNFCNYAFGAKARSMGNAFTAVADDLTAAFWNPAGLAALRIPEFYLGYKSSNQTHAYDLQDRKVGADTRLYNFDFDSKLNQIDFFSISAPAMLLKKPCTFALSYYRYIPYGFKGSAREVLTFLHDLYNPLKTTVTFTGSEGIDVLAFSLSAAPSEYFSLGATLQQFFGSGSMHFKTVSREGEFHSQFTEKLQGRTVILGMLFSPFTFLRLGFTWHSGLKSWFDSTLQTWDVNKKGEEINRVENSCQARVVVPDQYALGVLLMPARWLDLSAEVSRLDWDKATIENYYDAGITLPYPQRDSWKLSQKEVRNLRLGLEARLPLRTWKLYLRGGWSLDRQLYSDITDQQVKVTAYAAGIGCEFSRNLLMEIAYQSQKADWLENGYFGLSPDVPTHYRASVFQLALTYRFGHIFKE
jgi:hypothetical protein